MIELFDRQFIQIQAIGFLRGSSIANTFYFLDEVQNVKPEIMKDIITRLARGSKLILAGDPTQVNAPGLNERRNGLVYASKILLVAGRLNLIVRKLLDLSWLKSLRKFCNLVTMLF